MANASDNLNSSQDRALEEYLKCPICFDLFDTPRALSCLHTFCENCLTAYMEKDDIFGMVECPTCRQVSRIPDTSRHKSQWCKSLPMNYTILPLLETLHAAERKTGQREADHSTNVCVSCQVNFDVQTIYCMDCHGTICSNCLDLHKTLKVFKDHEVHNLNDKKSRTCKKHDAKALEFYCGNHKLALCSMCAVTEHRSCDNVTELKEDILKETVDLKTKELNDSLSTVNTGATKVLQIFCKQSEKFEKTTKSISEKYKVFREEIEKRQQIQENSKSKCQLLLAKVENTKKLLKVCQQSSTKNCMFIVLQNIATQCAEFDNELSGLRIVETDDWSADDVLRDFLSETRNPSTATISPRHVSTEQASFSTETVSFSTEGASLGSLSDSYLSEASSIEGMRLTKEVRWRFSTSSMLQRGAKGLAAWYVGMVFIGGDNIIAIDNQNNELVRLNTDCGVLDYLPLNAIPLGITKVNECCVAVIFRNESFIQLFYFDPEVKSEGLTLLEDIKLDINPLAIAHSSFGYTVVGSGVILNIDEKGTKLQEIKFDISSLNVRKCLTKHVMVNEDLGLVYISDQETNTLAVLGYGKDPVTKPFIKIKKMKSPHGLEFDVYNNVYVCSDRDSAVIVLNPYGDEITEIPILRCKAPTTITFNTERNKFWVTNRDSPECMKEFVITQHVF